MRRRRSRARGRSSGQRRRNNWSGFVWGGRNVVLQNDGEVATTWAIWPAGLRNEAGSFGGNEQEITPVDETLARSIISMNGTLDLFGLTQAQANVDIAFGLIAWEASSQSAGDLDIVIVGNGVVPHPIFDPAAEWILRVPMVFTRDNFSIGNIASEFITSRAMRKLPPRTGILACIGIAMPLDNSSDSATIDWTVDGRFLRKSGVYIA